MTVRYKVRLQHKNRDLSYLAVGDKLSWNRRVALKHLARAQASSWYHEDCIAAWLEEEPETNSLQDGTN